MYSYCSIIFIGDRAIIEPTIFHDRSVADLASRDLRAALRLYSQTSHVSQRDLRREKLCQLPWEWHGGKGPFRWRWNLWNAPKTTRDVYQTSRFFAMRRGQGACKFPTAVCILSVLDSAQLYAAVDVRGRDLEAATADNARHLRHLERNEEPTVRKKRENEREGETQAVRQVERRNKGKTRRRWIHLSCMYAAACTREE